MKTSLLTAAGAFVVVVGLASGAHAQCWWTGLGTACAAPVAPPVYTTPYWDVPPVYAPYSAYWNYGEPNVNWNGGASSYPGPRASGHGH